MSNFTPTQFVLVDDTDPRIQYSGDWAPEVRGATDGPAGWGIFGPAHNHTLMRISSDGEFTFTFNGTSIAMEGTIDTLNSRPKPTWTCFIDSQSTKAEQASDNNRSNHWPICDSGDTILEPKEHTFRFRVTVPAGGIFWVDRLQYSPSETISVTETMYISDEDSTVSYSPASNFNRSGDIVHATDMPGSAVTLKFTGSSASLFALFEPNLPASKGFYSLDGQPTVPFTIPHNSGSNTVFNQEIIRIPDLPPTNHTLVATFDGQRGDTPFSVDYFYVTLPPKNTTEIQVPDKKHSTPVGAIVGGVVGGVALLALIILAVFFLRRRQRQRETGSSVYEDKLTVPTPFISTSPYQAVPVAETEDVHSPGGSSLYASTQLVPLSEASTAVQKQQMALSSYTHPEREVDVVHVDSGLRLGDPGASGSRPAVVHDIPPQYTEN